METKSISCQRQEKASRKAIILTIFAHQHSGVYDGNEGKIMNDKSMTVPDEALSVRELLLNHSKGAVIDTASRESQAMYLEDYELPVIEDIVDLQEHRELLETRLSDVNAKIEEERKLELEVKDVEPEPPTDDSGIDQE